MWRDDNIDIMKLYSIINESHYDYPLPAVCPICGERSGHLYMHRHDEDGHGELWVWCSSCHNYSHSSCKVPEWWRNLSNISPIKLQHSPEYLEDQADKIDHLTNVLISIHSDKLLKEDPKPVYCDKCGALMESTPGSVICPDCGWGWATSYFDPIDRDTTEYQITLLEGNETSVDVIKAVNQVSHLNYLKSREAIEGAPRIIYNGDASDVYDMRAILDGAYVKYKIEPDFLYE